MFKHILIPTDGSKLAAKGARTGIGLAQSLGARVTALYVISPYIPPIYGEAALYYVPGTSPEESRMMLEKQALRALAAVQKQASSAGVRCAIRHITASQPWEAILRTARTVKCDAIAMATHGRSGLGGLILGSETVHVVAKSKVPVIVVR